jgi:hypothetical protein
MKLTILSYNLRNKDRINKIWNIVQQPLPAGYKIQKATQEAPKSFTGADLNFQTLKNAPQKI